MTDKANRASEKRTLASPWAVAAVTLLAHTVIALMTPLPGYFRKYALAAEQYLRGELPLERLVDFSPLYFHLSVAAERWLPAPEAAVHWLQVVLAAVSAGLLFGLLRRRFSLPLAAAMVAVFGIDRHLLVYERVLEPEILLLFFLLGFLYFLDRGSPLTPNPSPSHPLHPPRERGASTGPTDTDCRNSREGGGALSRREGVKGWERVGVRDDGGRGAWIAGVFAALSIATRPTFLPVFLLAPIFLVLHDRAHWRKRSFALLVPVAAMLGLLAVRAAMVTGDPRAPVMNPGTVFFEGNNPLSRGTSAIYPPLVLELMRHAGEIPDSAHHVYRVVARADAGRELSIAEVNAYWAGRATAFVRAEPRRFARLVLEKLNRCFHGFRWHDIPSAWQYDRWLKVPTISFALVATLALLGALFEVRRWRLSLLYYAAGAAQLAVMLAFYVSARQRLILVPVAIYFAAAAVERLATLGRRGVLAAVLVLLMTFVLWIPDDLMRDETYRRLGHGETDRLLHEIRDKTRHEPLAKHADLAVAAMAASPWWIDWLRPTYFPRTEGSLEERVAEALAQRPRDPFTSIPSDFDLAAVSLEAGRLETARRLLESLVEADAVVYRGGRQPSQPLLLLGRIDVLQGDVAAGRAAIEEALERAPGDLFVLTELAALTGEPHYREQLDAFWSRLDARYHLGRALLRYGKAEEAAEALRFVIEKMPDFREPQVLLAAALAELGATEEAAHTYLRASQIRLEPIVAAEEITALFRRWAAENPERPDVRLYSAQVLHQHGYFEEAMTLLEGLDPPDVLRQAVEEERQKLQRVLP